MSSARPNHSAVSALWSATWEYILSQMQTLFVCGSPRSGTNPSGGYMALTSTLILYASWQSSVSRAHSWLTPRWQTPSGQRNGAVVAALYVYSSYSPFEDMVNRYMSEGVPIKPIISMDQVTGVDNDSLVFLTNSTQYDRHLPVNISALHNVILLDGPQRSDS